MRIRRTLAAMATSAVLAVGMLVAGPLSGFAGRGQAAGAWQQAGTQLVHLQAGAFDPRAGLPAVHSSLDAADPAPNEAALYLVQFAGPVLDAQKQEVTAMGAALGDYLPDSAFLARMHPELVDKVRALPFVRAVELYKPAFKLERALLDASGAPVTTVDGKDTARLVVRAFDGSLNLAARLFTGLGGRVVAAAEGGQVTGEMPLSRLAELARSPDVVSISLVKPMRLFNDKAAGIMKVSPVWQSGLDGRGQIVGVADTGIDTGRNDSSLHRDLQGRVKQIFALARPNDASDPHGHGTHVAGSILGNGANSSGQYKGIAPGASLVFQSVGDGSGSLGGLGNDLRSVWSQAYQAGARIHSNSWGGDARGGYDASSNQLDDFVWKNPDMAIVMAAGNSGQNQATRTTVYQSIATPGTAKNAITVGASENDRRDRGTGGDNPNEVAFFSSRGWAADGRVKPDIVAPGTWILSTKSSRASASNFWAPFNEFYAFMGGTSMATPLTSGALAVLRQHFVDRLQVQPKASLLKASLIHGAVDMGLGVPSRDQGWGRVDLQSSISPADGRQVRFENEGVALTTGQTKDYTVKVAAGKPLKVTLVWTDYPASPSASKALVNDLDLTVVGPGGELKGNDFQRTGAVDRVNNVENVFVAQPQAGDYTIRIRAANVPQGPQRFALVYSGALGDSNQPPAPPPGDDRTAPTVAITAPQNGAAVSGNVNVTANATDNVAVTKVELYVDGQLAGTDTSAPYQWTWNSAGVPNGQHQLTARASDAAGNVGQSAVVTVQVNNGGTQPPPPPPPGDGTRTETFTGAVSWFQTRSHRIDVTGTGTVTASLGWQGNANLDLYLVNPAGQVVARAAGTTANPERISYPVSSPGTYELRVQATFWGAAYTLNATYPTGGGTTPPENPPQPPPGGGERVETGKLQSGQARDYQFTVSKQGLLSVQLDWANPDPAVDFDLYLYNGFGWPIAQSNRTNKPEKISIHVPPGNYRVRVKSFAGTSDYTLRLTIPQ